MLRRQIRIYEYWQASTHDPKYGIYSRLRWPAWFLRDMMLDCWMEFDLVDGGDKWRIPDDGRMPNERIRVQVHGFHWLFVQHNRGEDFVTFAPSEDNHEIATAVQRPLGYSWNVRLHGSWKGVSVFTQQWRVNCTGLGADWHSFNFEKM